MLCCFENLRRILGNCLLLSFPKLITHHVSRQGSWTREEAMLFADNLLAITWLATVCSMKEMARGAHFVPGTGCGVEQAILANVKSKSDIRECALVENTADFEEFMSSRKGTASACSRFPGNSRKKQFPDSRKKAEKIPGKSGNIIVSCVNLVYFLYQFCQITLLVHLGPTLGR